MSEQEEERPLTRREIRLREMAAAANAQGEDVDAVQVEDIAEQVDDTAEQAGISAEAEAPTELSGTVGEAFDIEISPFNEDGTPRTRREIRELREQALAERAEAEQLEEVANAESAEDAPAGEVPAEDVSAETEPVEESQADADSEPEESADSETESEPEFAAEEEPPAKADSEAEALIEAEEQEELSVAEAALAEESVSEQDVPDADVAQTEDGAAEVNVAEADADVAEANSVEVDAAEPGSEDTEDGPETSKADFDVPTQPFSVNDLKEAEQRSDDSGGDTAEESSAEVVDASVETQPESDVEAVPPPKSGLRFPWKRSAKPAAQAVEAAEAVAQSADQESSIDAAESATDEETVAETADDAEPVTEVLSTEANSEETISNETFSGQGEAAAVEEEPEATDEGIETTDERPLDVAEEAAAVDEISSPVLDDAEEGKPESGKKSPSAQTEYSFPNIEPPEEWRSVFDDPSTRVVPTSQGVDAPAPSEGFDDLISRAVVQEGSTGGVGSAALILPEMPDDAGVTGTLGGTGELFVTGSIEVPKSIGETGGHASLHDSVDADQLDDLKMAPAGAHNGDSGPVSARRAVSAISQTGVPDQSQVKQDRSRLPLILSLTGGGLVVIVGGLVIWGATNGFFG